MKISKTTVNTKAEAPNVGLSGKVFAPVVKWLEGKAEKIHERSRGLASQLAQAENNASSARANRDRRSYARAFNDIGTLDRKITENNKKAKWYSTPAKILHELGVKDRGYLIPSVAAKAGIKDKNWGSLLLRNGKQILGLSPYKVEHKVESNLGSIDIAPVVKTGDKSKAFGAVVETGNDSIAVGAKVKTGDRSLSLGADVETGNNSTAAGIKVKSGDNSLVAGAKVQTGTKSTAIAAHGTTGEGSWNLSVNGAYNAANRAYTASKNFLSKTFASKPKPEGKIVKLPLATNDNDTAKAA